MERVLWLPILLLLLLFFSFFWVICLILRLIDGEAEFNDSHKAHERCNNIRGH